MVNTILCILEQQIWNTKNKTGVTATTPGGAGGGGLLQVSGKPEGPTDSPQVLPLAARRVGGPLLQVGPVREGHGGGGGGPAPRRSPFPAD